MRDFSCGTFQLDKNSPKDCRKKKEAKERHNIDKGRPGSCKV
jgi:hypothetical protein